MWLGPLMIDHSFDRCESLIFETDSANYFAVCCAFVDYGGKILFLENSTSGSHQSVRNKEDIEKVLEFVGE